MPRQKTPEQRLEELEQQKKQLKEQMQQRQKELEQKAKRERQLIRQRERKQDTRRKILAGAKLFEWAREDREAAELLQSMIEELEGSDREPFEDWDPPSPSNSAGEGQ